MVGKIHRNSRLYAHIFRKATEWEILPPSIVQRAFGAESAFSLSPGFADVDPGQININNCEYRQEPDPLPIPIPIANPTAPCLMSSCHAINAAKWQMQNELHTQVAVESDEWLPWLRLFFFDFCFFFSYNFFQIIFQGQIQQKKSQKYYSFIHACVFWAVGVVGETLIFIGLSIFVFPFTFPWEIVSYLMGYKFSFVLCLQN